MCLRIIGEHFIRGEVKQLLMFITGIGGSGKSHVIRATVELFRRCGAPEKLTLSAPTGSAAVLIDGYTIHALTFLPKREAPVKQHDLEYIWRTVEYLILDEASLLSAELLSQVSHRICQAKSWDETARDKPFGGVNVIFAGDFGQLRPPMSNALYSYKLVNQLNSGTTQTSKGQTALHGAFLWRQVDVVVELKQNWRAKDDAVFVDMLSRIRLGKVRKMAVDRQNLSDYDLLKTRLLTEIKNKLPEQFDSFKDAPIVVTRKYLRDAINETKARAFAVQTGQEYFVYHAKDRIGGKALEMNQQRRLWKLQTTNTNDSLGRLPLIPGMPIMITENAATSCKIVNGSRGTLQSITFDLDEDGNRFPVCALVHIKDSTLYVPGLDEGVIPILPITGSFPFPMGEKKVNVRRTQLPILPGWAFTDFKVQGSYMPKVIVDLAGARSLQSIYVMLSRASTLKNVAILRWFSSRVLHAELQGDARRELQRLCEVERMTRARFFEQHNLSS
jgi:ATP-dependent DNA helicase PIF1